VNTAPQLSTLGKYRLIATIGHGGMAHIHLALMAGPAGFNKLLVIKALRDDMAAGLPGVGPSSDGNEFVTMFLDEARLAARLNHQNIVQTYEVGEVSNRFFIAMEYLEGQSLKSVERRIKQPGLPVPAHLRILSEVAKGLHHAHELKDFDGHPLDVVHRDVSPHNVFLTYDGQVKLLDFGIAKAKNAVHRTKVGVIKGKAEYIAPEQIRGEHVDRRADVFSLGVMLWEALAGRRFAGGPEVAEIAKMQNRLTGAEAKIRTVRPDVPERLAQICERALSLSPSVRHATALEFAHDLDEYLSEASIYPSAQQLSDIIAPPFAQERQQLRRLIDQQMKAAIAPGVSFDGQTGQLPMVPRSPYASGVWQMKPPSLSTGGTLGGLSSNTPTSLRSGYGNTNSSYGSMGSAGSAHGSTGSAGNAYPGSGYASGATGRIAGPLHSLPPMAHTQPQAAFRLGSEEEPTKRRVPWPVAVACIALSVGSAGYFALRPVAREASASAPPAPVGAITAQAPVSTPAPAQAPAPLAQAPENTQVELSIQVEPRTALVMLDGARVSRVPFRAKVERGFSMHTLEVSAPGFEGHREMITYDRDVRVRVRLERQSSSRKRARGDESAPVASAEVAAPAPVPEAPASKPSRDVEPGSDFRRLSPSRPAVAPEVVLEEDPYR
jgi:serine/threonine-protein kinase